MALAPEIASFGDLNHQKGESGLTIIGGGLGAFPGRVLMCQNADGSGLVDVLTVGGPWSDTSIAGIGIPVAPNNAPGTVYAIVEREDLAWSQALSFTLSVGYPGVPNSRCIRPPSGGVWVVDPDAPSFCEVDFSDVLPTGVNLASVARTVPTGLTEQDAVTDTVGGRFALKLTGMQHASMHQIQLVATLSNAQTIAVTAPLRAFNG